jgi:hypothetical protein
MPCAFVGRYQHFRETYCLLFMAEDGDSMFLQNVGICLQVWTVLQPEDQHQ